MYRAIGREPWPMLYHLCSTRFPSPTPSLPTISFSPSPQHQHTVLVVQIPLFPPVQIELRIHPSSTIHHVRGKYSSSRPLLSTSFLPTTTYPRQQPPPFFPDQGQDWYTGFDTDPSESAVSISSISQLSPISLTFLSHLALQQHQIPISTPQKPNSNHIFATSTNNKLKIQLKNHPKSPKSTILALIPLSSRWKTLVR
jgi:hypothetical protein